MKQRYFSLDLIKAFAIYLVIMDHLVSSVDGIDNLFRTFIYSCHMPLFFFVSGVLAYRKLETVKDVCMFFAKKCRLLIPVVVFGIGNVIVLHQDIGEFLIWHKFGLWFLWTLFLFFVIYAIVQLALIRNSNKIVEVIGLILPALVCIYLRKYKDSSLGGVFNFLNLYNYSFFLVGVLIRRYDLNKLCMKDIPQSFFFFIYLTGLITGIPALNIPMKICGILIAYRVAACSSSHWQGEKLATWQLALLKVGQSSLFIYVLHYYFIIGVHNTPEPIRAVIFSSACYYLLVYSIIALFIIFSCILISEVLKMNRIIRLLTFGVK